MIKLISQAMAWKYQAKCAKTLDGLYIDAWEHPTMPKPTKTQMDLDIVEYEAYISSGQQADDEKSAKFEQDIIKAMGLTIKDFMNEIIGGRTSNITNAQLKTKFKSHL